MTLRTYDEKDASGAKELILAILSKEYPFDKSAYSDSDLDKIGEVYQGERNSFFVIEDGGMIVGTVGVKEDSKDTALLRRLFVDVRYRKRGYGTQLIKQAVQFCVSKDYQHMVFRCTDRMVDAMNLCKKNGFKEIEQLEVSGFKIHRLVLDL